MLAMYHEAETFRISYRIDPLLKAMDRMLSILYAPVFSKVS